MPILTPKERKEIPTAQGMRSRWIIGLDFCLRTGIRVKFMSSFSRSGRMLQLHALASRLCALTSVENFYGKKKTGLVGPVS